MTDHKHAFPNELALDEPFQERALEFLVAYASLPTDAPIAVHPGAGDLDDGRIVPALVINLGGRLFGFTSVEARMVAQIAASMPCRHPFFCATVYDGLHSKLLEAADQCEQYYGEKTGHGIVKH